MYVTCSEKKEITNTARNWRKNSRMKNLRKFALQNIFVFIV